MYFETVEHIVIRRSFLEQLNGNGIVVYGRAQDVEIANNRLSQIGMNGIAIVPKTFFRVNAYRQPTISKLLHSTRANVSYNRVLDFGTVLTQSAAILLVGNRRTTREWNLVHDFPPGATSYQILNAGKLHRPDRRGD